ncbi:hypothetical protein FJR39_08775 [Dolichospermum flos-aquae UHCC 0037]|uniref:Uncharacterized protein n=1 Tax=Dolichospermum flos-aquae UHCC 0037 TaxID=2590026 RepID=A0ACC7S4K6_DOLFA|nr:hypothetical protein [Dolichospermum flos-aquae UHCC 0037]
MSFKGSIWEFHTSIWLRLCTQEPKKLKFQSLDLQSKKRCFYKMRSRKKTVSLFQSHVFKHEFFLFPVSCSLLRVPCPHRQLLWLTLRYQQTVRYKITSWYFGYEDKYDFFISLVLEFIWEIIILINKSFIYGRTLPLL